MGFVTKSPWTSGSSPSWLLKLLPHPYTCPFLFKTSTCSAPTLISTMSSRPCTGQGRFNLHSVSDNAVRSWMPQVSTCPLAVKKTDKFLPTPILTMSLPRSSSMICGVPKNYMCNQYNPPTNAQDLLNNKKSPLVASTFTNLAFNNLFWWNKKMIFRSKNSFSCPPTPSYWMFWWLRVRLSVLLNW